MEIQVHAREQVTIVEIAGSVDSLTAETLTSAMRGEIERERSRLVADFRQVEYISSAGLRALLATVKDARRLGGDLRLAGVSPQVLRVLEISGFTTILNLFDGVDAAVGSFDA
jgi:anti-sigma B factor antagonist